MRGVGVGSILKSLGCEVSTILTPTLSFSGTVATIAGGEPLYDNILMYALQGTDQWGSLGARVGNGEIDFGNHPLPNNTYDSRVMSVGSPGVVSDAVDLVINNAVNLDYPDNNWDRWVFASVCQHFDDRRDGVFMYTEGTHRVTSKRPLFIELRMDGPSFTEVSKNCWLIKIEVNILIQAAKDNKDFHRLRKTTGIVSRAFTSNIEVFKFGNELWDDQSLLGCLERVDGGRGRERIQINHFGQIEPTVELEQATTEAHYEMTLYV